MNPARIDWLSEPAGPLRGDVRVPVTSRFRTAP